MDLNTDKYREYLFQYKMAWNRWHTKKVQNFDAYQWLTRSCVTLCSYICTHSIAQMRIVSLPLWSISTMPKRSCLANKSE